MGLTWLVEKNPDNPSRPGRAVPVRSEIPSIDPAAKPSPLVIRAGDRVVVEEHSAAVEGRLEAVALSSAAVGSFLDVRLKIGSEVVRAVALAAGRAAIVSPGEGRPGEGRP
jgi:hypothetical protein